MMPAKIERRAVKKSQIKRFHVRWIGAIIFVGVAACVAGLVSLESPASGDC